MKEYLGLDLNPNELRYKVSSHSKIIYTGTSLLNRGDKTYIPDSEPVPSGWTEVESYAQGDTVAGASGYRLKHQHGAKSSLGSAVLDFNLKEHIGNGIPLG